MVRPLGVFQKRKRRPPGPRHIFLDRRRRQRAVNVDGRKSLLHPARQLRVRQAINPADRDLGQRPFSDDRFRQPQPRRPQMPPHQTRVRAQRLGKRILRALDRVFRLRRRRAALFPGLHLAAERLPAFRKQNHAETVHQQLRRLLRRLRLFYRRAPDPALQRPCVQDLLARLVRHLRQRAHDLLGNIPARRQSVEKQYRQQLPAAKDLPRLKIRRIFKLRRKRPSVYHRISPRGNYCAAKREKLYGSICICGINMVRY